MTTDLPVADRWFKAKPAGLGVTMLTEPYVEFFFQSNVWHVRGRDRDLVVDTGNGIGDLRGELRPFTEIRPVVAVVTHGHFDHVGGLHAFDERVCHRLEAADVGDPFPLPAFRADYPDWFELEIRQYGYEVPETTVRAWPPGGFDRGRFGARPSTPTRLVEEADLIELGDRVFEVLHLPGHTAGSIGLWEEATGVLFSGDTVYVVDALEVSDKEAFAGSLRRLRELPVEVVHAGHNASFGRPELHRLIDSELARLDT